MHISLLKLNVGCLTFSSKRSDSSSDGNTSVHREQGFAWWPPVWFIAPSHLSDFFCMLLVKLKLYLQVLFSWHWQMAGLKINPLCSNLSSSCNAQILPVESQPLSDVNAKHKECRHGEYTWLCLRKWQEKDHRKCFYSFCGSSIRNVCMA